MGDEVRNETVTTNENNGIYEQELKESLKSKPLNDRSALIL